MRFLTSRVLVLAGSMIFASAASAFNFGDAAKIAGQLSGADTSATQAGNSQGVSALNLISALNGLNVTPQQALGGTGALLAVAQNQLPANQYSSLLSSVPGVEKLTGANSVNQLSTLSNLAGMLGGKKQPASLSDTAIAALSNVQTMNDANQAFSALGMDAGLVAQFAPLLLQYLGNQGAAGGLVQSLASVWGVQQ